MSIPSQDKVREWLRLRPASEVAAVLGVSDKTVYRWRWGHHEPFGEHLRAIVRLMKIGGKQ